MFSFDAPSISSPALANKAIGWAVSRRITSNIKIAPEITLEGPLPAIGSKSFDDPSICSHVARATFLDEPESTVGPHAPDVPSLPTEALPSVDVSSPIVNEDVSSPPSLGAEDPHLVGTITIYAFNSEYFLLRWSHGWAVHVIVAKFFSSL